MAIKRTLSVAVAVLLAAGVGFGTGYLAADRRLSRLVR